MPTSPPLMGLIHQITRRGWVITFRYHPGHDKTMIVVSDEVKGCDWHDLLDTKSEDADYIQKRLSKAQSVLGKMAGADKPPIKAMLYCSKCGLGLAHWSDEHRC